MEPFEDDAEVARALAADLATDEPERRVLSSLRAGREGGARCVPLLAGALSDADPGVRAAAAESLRELAERAQEYGDPPIVAMDAAQEALRRSAADPTSPQVRRASVAALALSDSAEATPTFIASMRDENAGVRAEAVRGLWRRGGEQAGQALRERIRDEDPLVRYYALLAVDELMPSGFMDDLVHLLADPRADVAAEAAFLLAERGDHRATPILVKTMPDRDLGFEAARLLGVLGDVEARPALRRFSAKFFADPLTRLRAVASAWQLGDADAEKTLLGALGGWRKPVRGLAIEVLSEGRSAAAFERILAIAAREGDYHVCLAARGLGRYADARALPVLTRLLQHADRDVREDAAWAVGRIGGDDARRALREMLARESDDEVLAAIRAALEGVATGR